MLSEAPAVSYNPWKPRQWGQGEVSGAMKAAETCLSEHQVPSSCACRELITGRLPLLTLPSPGSGI